MPYFAAFRRFSPFAYNEALSPKNGFLLKISVWLAALKTLGAWGVLLLAAVDSAAIPIPLDALVAGYVYTNPHQAWLYTLAAAVGSALGCLIPFGLGRAGGELFLLKRMDPAKMKRIRDRFEKQEFLALMIPAMLPPPTPFKLFVFSAGVFEMRVRSFLFAIIGGRLVRFGILSVLTVKFGPQVVAQTKDLIKNHLGWTLAGIVILALAIYLVFRLMKQPIQEVADEIQHPEKASS
jgi:membrane protein YqaA with SNARE-associated domain